MYVGLIAVLVNLVVAVVFTLIRRAAKVADGIDGTTSNDYFADEGDARLVPAPREGSDAAVQPVVRV